MTNATLPTSVSVSLLGGLVKIYVDQYSSIIPIGGTGAQLVTINGTNYKELVSFLTGSVYGAVPVSTSMRIYGFESVGAAGSQTVILLGYDDDGAGTNFVTLFDILNSLAGVATNNVITGLLTIPTGKHVVLKQTNGSAQNITLQIKALLTN